VSRINKNTDEKDIRLYLNDEEKLKLEKIVKELYQAKSIETEDTEEFLKITVFIVLYEYDKNKLSLNEFYRKNKEVYKQSKANNNNNNTK
jgi:hypothetical protein